MIALASAIVSGQDQSLPRFRAGANLVTVDAYVVKDGTAVADLTAAEIEILEDDRPQRIEGFRLIRSTAQGVTTSRQDPLGIQAEREAASDPDARVFVMFFDQWHVSFDGSARSSAPVAALLNRVIDANDLVGLMTPEMPARSMPLTRRTAAIERMVRDTLNWGERDKANTSDPREAEIQMCYPESDPRFPQFRGVAKEMIERRRERKTLEALDDLVGYLGNLRDERKFVMLLSEGWVLFGRNDRLGAVLVEGSLPGPPGVGISGGRISTEGTTAQSTRIFESCERERVTLAFIDHSLEIRELAQRANRANVTFYAVDPRGLAAFDDSIGPVRPATPVQDAQRMTARQTGLRELAENTDGAVVLNTNDVGGGVARMMADLGSYYLVNYYSTNTRLDGRFRRITVRVKRPGVEVRARQGYLAPTEAEARAAGGGAPPDGSAGSVLAPAVSRALDAIAPARGNLPVRIQATGARGTIRAIVELDAVTARQPEWSGGGSVKLTVSPERGGAEQTMTVPIGVGQRSVPIDGLDAPLSPGRYTVRAELAPKNGRLPIQVTTFAAVPAEDAIAGAAMLALRRGPSTGLAYVPTADPRFRRTERLRAEVPLVAEGVTATGRVLTKEGQPLPLIVTFSTRVDAAKSITLGVADVTLAPLAAGDFVLELMLTKDAKTEIAAYGFRIIP